MTEKIYTQENSDYLKNNPTWHVEDSPWKAKQIIKMLDRNPLEIKSIAEVGCGVGEILNQLHHKLKNDINYTGYDVSIDAISQAKKREKERLQFKHTNFLETENRYDLLLMMDVFEHVDDYLGFIRSCRKKANYTIFHIPLDIDVLGVLRNVPMKTREAVGHLHYFTKQTALATLEDCGYEIIDSFYTAGMLDLPNKKLKTRIAAIPRKLMFKINKDFTVKLMGGYSLLVLAK
ncbi:class I SAM-dependent methyltransferase [Jejudonia soesokkakensis]|uniref:Class I SAM-dependent methyltransferase n=1 Tax=Jejudonia soesokkakensis TaxID=1323432 RepID=A0ABW2MTH5_9FLAO